MHDYVLSSRASKFGGNRKSDRHPRMVNSEVVRVVSLSKSEAGPLATPSSAREPGPRAGTRVVIGDIVLDRAAHLVTVDGQPVHLALREFRVLELLMTNVDRVLENTRMLREVWGADFRGDPGTLTVHVLRVRKKLELALPGSGAHLRTVRGLGYVFDAVPVVELA